MALSRSTALAAFAAAVAVLFGAVTVVTGSRVLLGADPGYAVFRPLLLFNTVMGFAYITVGILAWRRSSFATRGAGLVALLNAAVLGSIVFLYVPSGPIALTSLQAMALRTTVWVVLFLVLLGASRAGSAGSRTPAEEDRGGKQP